MNRLLKTLICLLLSVSLLSVQSKDIRSLTVNEEPSAAEHILSEGVNVSKSIKVQQIRRISGSNRYATSMMIAEEVRNQYYGSGRFNSIVIASGTNYPDALSGSYLACKENTALLLISEKNAGNITQYVRDHVAYGGNVYVLGGTGAVDDSWISSLTGSYEVLRLSGRNRYETNRKILEASSVSSGTILVCTGKGFADSLSCSSLGLPILLVDKSLKDFQREYLASLNRSNVSFAIIGGTGAVSDDVVNELRSYGNVAVRIFGKNRYETSVQIAQYYYHQPQNIVVATGRDFPDGLSGGPLAKALGAPLLLVDDKSIATAENYVNTLSIQTALTLGGTNAVSEEAVNHLFYIEKTGPVVPVVPDPIDEHPIVYWTASGEKYHYYETCTSLKKSKNIYSGTLEEALRAGKKELCKICEQMSH